MLLINHPPKEPTCSYLDTGSKGDEVARSLLPSLLIGRAVREDSSCSLGRIHADGCYLQTLWELSDGDRMAFPVESLLLRAAAGARSCITSAIGKVENRNRDVKDWVIEKAI